MFSSLFFVWYLFEKNPFESPTINNFEKMNEIFTLFNNYGLMMFSDFNADPVTKYKVGFYFIYYIAFTGVINVLLVFRDLLKAVIPKIQKRLFKGKLDNYF
jgi:hypothetical protein